MQTNEALCFWGYVFQKKKWQNWQVCLLLRHFRARSTWGIGFLSSELSAFDVTQWPHTRRSSGVRTNRNPSDAANPKRSYFSVGLLRAPLTAWIKAHNASIQKTDTSVGITEADEKKKKKKKTKQLINCFFFSFLFNKLKCWVTFKHLAETR